MDRQENPLSTRRFGPLHFYREALSIALPVMLQFLIMSLVSLVDNFMVAGLGDDSMAGVNVANQLNFVFFIIVNSICSAGGIYLSQFRGAGNKEGMKHAFRFKVIFALAAFTIYGSFCMSIPHNMIGMMTNGNGAQAHIIKIGGGYLRLAVISLLPFALSTVIGSCLRETGKPKIPLFISAAATIVNTIGNWFLIYGNLGAPRLEVTGAAISTIIARSVEVAAYLIYAYKAKPDFFVPFAKIFKIDVKLIFTILQKSGMLFLSELSWISSETIMTAMYNGRGGAETVAGMAAGFTICNLFYLAFGGVWTATNVIIGSSLGAGKLTEARERGRWILYGSIILGAIVAVIGSAGATVIIPVVFSNLTENARIISSSLVYIVAIYMPLWTLLNAFFAITRAGGDTAAGMWADLVVNTFMYAPGAILLALFTTLSPVLMFALLKITDIPKFIIVHHFYKKGRWVKNLTNV